MAPSRGGAEVFQQRQSNSMWQLALDSLQEYALEMKSVPWQDVEVLCLEHATKIEKHINRLPHNAPTTLLPMVIGDSGMPSILNATAPMMVKELMTSIQQLLAVEEYLCPGDFKESISVGRALSQAEIGAAELTDLLSAAADWKIVQAGEWHSGEILERLAAYLRWESNLVTRFTEAQHNPVHLESIGAHSTFLIEFSRLVSRHAGFIAAALPDGSLVAAVAVRCGSAATALESDAKTLLHLIQKVAKRRFTAAEKWADHKEKLSVMEIYLQGQHLNVENQRRSQVDASLERDRAAFTKHSKVSANHHVNWQSCDDVVLSNTRPNSSSPQRWPRSAHSSQDGSVSVRRPNSSSPQRWPRSARNTVEVTLQRPHNGYEAQDASEHVLRWTQASSYSESCPQSKASRAMSYRQQSNALTPRADSVVAADPSARSEWEARVQAMLRSIDQSPTMSSPSAHATTSTLSYRREVKSQSCAPRARGGAVEHKVETTDGSFSSTSDELRAKLETLRQKTAVAVHALEHPCTPRARIQETTRGIQNEQEWQVLRDRSRQGVSRAASHSVGSVRGVVHAEATDASTPRAAAQVHHAGGCCADVARPTND